MTSPFDLCIAFGPFKMFEGGGRGRLIFGKPAFSECSIALLTQGGASAIELGCETSI